MSNHTFNTSIGEVAVKVDFDYQPAEPETLKYPGCKGCVELFSVIIPNYDNFQILGILDNAVTSELKTECLEHLATY